MVRLATVLCALVMLAACAAAPRISAEARADLVPSGKLRAGVNFGNVLLTAKDAETGVPRGIAVDLARELGRRLGAPVVIVAYESAGRLAASAGTGAWDVAFLGAEPQRAKEIVFTAPYAKIEATYLVPPGSSLRIVADVDQEHVRIAVPEASAYDLYLSRSLRRATLVRARAADGAFKAFTADKLEALAGLRPRLIEAAERIPGSRILPGGFTSVQQAVGIPAGRAAGAQYLRAFIEDVKASGFVARLIEKHAARGVSVAPLHVYGNVR